MPPISLEECKCCVKYAKSLPSYEQAVFMETYLYQRANNDTEVLKEIAGIRHYFSEEIKQGAIAEACKKIEARLRSHLELPRFLLNDDQIAKAIIETQKDMRSNRDWFGYYRILVDFCDYPSTMTKFSTRISRLDFPGPLKFPCDYSIKKTNGSFYQGLKNGGSCDWPAKYIKWSTFIPAPDDTAYPQRKKVADSFFNYLKGIKE